MDLLVQIYPETEEYVTGGKRMAIGEPQALTELQSIAPCIPRNLPGFGKSGFRPLGLAVNVNQVCCHAPDDVPGDVIESHDRIERLGLGTFGYHQSAAVSTDFTVSP